MTYFMFEKKKSKIFLRGIHCFYLFVFLKQENISDMNASHGFKATFNHN